MLTVPEAAARLGVQRQWVWRLIKAGRLDAEQHGKVWLIHEEALANIRLAERPEGRPRKKGSEDAATS